MWLPDESSRESATYFLSKSANTSLPENSVMESGQVGMVLNRFGDLNVQSVSIAGWVEDDTTVYPGVQNFALDSDNLVLILGRMRSDITNIGFH